MSDSLLEIKNWPSTFIMENITDEMTTLVSHLAETIDPSNYSFVLTFGTDAQKQLVKFSQLMLQFTKKNDQLTISQTMDSIGDFISSMTIEELKEENKSLFKKIKQWFEPSTNEKLSNFTQTNAKMDRLMIILERNKIILNKDIDYLNKLFKQNEMYIQTIDTHIAAAKLRLKNLVIENEELIKNATPTDWKEEKRRNQLLDGIEILQSRIYELQLSREVGLQMLMQTRMLLSSNKLLVEKIQSSLTTTIPLWRNQFSIYLSSLKAKQTSEFNQRINDLHNQLSKKQINNTATNQKLNVEQLRLLHQKLTTMINETVQLEIESKQVKDNVYQKLGLINTDLSNRLENGDHNVRND